MKYRNNVIDLASRCRYYRDIDRYILDRYTNFNFAFDI